MRLLISYSGVLGGAERALVDFADALGTDTCLDFLPGPVIGALIRMTAASADRVLVPSAAVAADLDPAGRLGDRIAVINPAVEVESFAHLNGRPAHPPEVLVLGALVGWKRPELA